MNEFFGLRLSVLGVLMGKYDKKTYQKLIKEHPKNLETYHERASIMGYNLKILNDSDREKIKSLDNLVGRSKNLLSFEEIPFEEIKDIVNEAYLIFYGERAFN